MDRPCTLTMWKVQPDQQQAFQDTISRLESVLLRLPEPPGALTLLQSVDDPTVFHTIGYPEPEIFGFLYVHPDRVASVGIFVPSWFDSPVRTSYRYLQHFVQHPYISSL